jgi:MFS family permease
VLTPIARLYLIWVAVHFFTFAFPTTLINFYLDAMGFNRGWIGLFHAASQVGGLVLALPAIGVFQRIGRRRALVFGAVFASLLRLPTVLSPVPEVILAAEALSGFGTAMFGLASVSLLADASQPDQRAAVFGLSDFVRMLAVLLGSVAAGGLPALIAPLLQSEAQSAASYRAVLATSFVVRALAAIPLVLIARRKPSLDDPTASLPEIHPARYLNPRVLLSQRLRIYALSIPFALLLLTEALLFTFFNLILRDWFGANDAQVGVIVGLSALVGSLAALLAPRMVQGLGYRRAIVSGVLVSAGAIVAFALSPTLLLGTLAIFIQVAFDQITRVLYRVYAVNAVLRSEYFILGVVMSLAANIGPTIAPPIGGWLQSTSGYVPLFAAATGLSVLAAAVFALLDRWLSTGWLLPALALAFRRGQQHFPRTPDE